MTDGQPKERLPDKLGATVTMDRLACTLMALLVLAASGAAAWAAAEPIPLTLTADTITGSLEEGGALEATGNARITYQDGSITADRIHLDHGQRVAAATGNVRVEREGQLLSGAELMYDLADGQGVIREARAEVHEEASRGELVAFLMGTEIAVGRDLMYIIKGRFTTCNREHPHYKVTADEWRYIPGKRIEARGAQVEIYGAKLPKVRKWTHRLEKGGKGSTSLMPRVGFSHVDGLYVGVNPSIQPKGSPFIAGLEGRMSLTQGFRGRGYTGLEKPHWSLEAAYGVNEDSYNDVVTGVVIDRLPEVAFEGQWGLGEASGTALGLRAGWGQFREFPGGLMTDRRHVDSRVSHVRTLGTKALLEAGVGFRYSDYGTGQHYRVISGRGHLFLSPTDDFDCHVGYLRHFVDGSTPFEFDDVDITRGLAAGFDWRLTKRWRLASELRYDFDRQRVRRAQFEIGRTFHCLEYSLHYDTVLKDFGFGVAIPGL